MYLMLASFGIKENCMNTFGLKVVVRMNISYIKSLVRHLISKLLTATFFILFIVSQIVLYPMRTNKYLS